MIISLKLNRQTSLHRMPSGIHQVILNKVPYHAFARESWMSSHQGDLPFSPLAPGHDLALFPLSQIQTSSISQAFFPSQSCRILDDQSHLQSS